MWSEAEADCTAALQLEPGNVKALVRRGAARLELGNAEGAVEVRMGGEEDGGQAEDAMDWRREGNVKVLVRRGTACLVLGNAGVLWR